MDPQKPTSNKSEDQPQKATQTSFTPDTQESESSVPTPQPVVMEHHMETLPGKPKRRIGKYLLMLLAAAVIITGAYMAYVKLTAKPAGDQSVADAKKDIPVINYGFVNITTEQLYPKFDVSDPNFTVQEQVFEPLVKYTDQSKISPLLATSWTNPDASTWDFTLKQNVKFHTGHTMTASDVVYSFDQAKQNDDLWGTFGNSIQSVKALSDSKVEIKTDKPDPFLLNKLTRIFILDAKGETSPSAANGTGPYQMKSGTKLNADKLELVAFDNYHGGHVYTRALNFIVVKDAETMVKGLNEGSLNLAGEFANKTPTGLDTSKFNGVRAEDLSVTMMVPNSVANGPMQKLAVRQALQYAIDRSMLIDKGNILAAPAHQMMIQSIPGYNTSLTATQRDVAKAKQLLASAGYPNGVTLTLSDTSGYEGVEAELTREAKEAGITIKLNRMADFNTLLQSFLRGKNELTLLSYSSDVLDGSDIFSSVLTDTPNYKNAQVNTKMEEAASTLDQAKRLQILQDISKIVYDDVAVVPLFNRQRYWFSDPLLVIPPSVSGDGNGPTNFWQAYQK